MKVPLLQKLLRAESLTREQQLLACLYARRLVMLVPLGRGAIDHGVATFVADLDRNNGALHDPEVAFFFMRLGQVPIQTFLVLYCEALTVPHGCVAFTALRYLLAVAATLVHALEQLDLGGAELERRRVLGLAYSLRKVVLLALDADELFLVLVGAVADLTGALLEDSGDVLTVVEDHLCIAVRGLDCLLHCPLFAGRRRLLVDGLHEGGRALHLSELRARSGS